MNKQIEVASPSYHPIHRQNGNGSSPRFVVNKTNNNIHSLIRQFMTGRLKDIPAYQTNSRPRDAWLQEWRIKEPLMAGIISSVVNIDANRGWSITGGRNLVNKWSSRTKNDSANGQGWRYFAKKASLSFWTTDMGNVVGTRREEPFAIATQQNGEIVINKTQLLALENIDPAQCELTNKIIKDMSDQVEGFAFDVPSRLTFNGNTPLPDWDYFRVASMINDADGFNDLGFCALSRALEFTRIMFALWQHDLEQLDAVMPKGFMLLGGVDENDWKTIMSQRKEDLTAENRQFYGGLQVLFGHTEDIGVEAKIVALSNLPAGFDLEMQTNTMMAGYALCFGYDPREFWPMSQGGLGTGKETETQAEKATTKGMGDWSLQFQENFQRELPITIHFEFEERNEAGELLNAQVDMAKAEVIDRMGQLRESSDPVLSNDEIRQLWAADGLIPTEWTETEEPITETDEGSDENIRERLLEYPKIRAACEVFQNEPIVQYHWRSDGPDKIIELWPSGYDALKRKLWQVDRTLYQGDGWQLTKEDLVDAR